MTNTGYGRSAVRFSRIGLGTAALGNLYRQIDDEQAAATVDAAWQAGIRVFDTAPHYWLGLSERRLGAELQDRPRDQYLLSTKVGRLLKSDPDSSAHRDEQGFAVTSRLRRTWDFSWDGVRRSLDESRARLGVDRIDVVLIHDPEESGDVVAAVTQAYPALSEMRSRGEIGAIGVGSKQCEVLLEFVENADLDVVMVAGRYTLLEQPAIDALLPACLSAGVAVLNAGVFNSGLLATDEPAGHYEYAPAQPCVVARARRIAAVCHRHGVSLPRAAL
jgi:D-threo-aldose 1-dehydrogenase